MNMGTGFVINVTYDQSAASLPSGFVAAINYAVTYFESIITSPSTVNIDVGFGTIAGQPLASGVLGESETLLANYSYGTIQSALAAVDPGAAASMPTSAPAGGSMFIGTAEAKSLSLALQQSSSSLDGYVGFSNTLPFTYDPTHRAVPGSHDFIGVVEHEFTEVMGRIDLFGQTLAGTAAYSLLDMFHYSSPKTHNLTGTTANYFSVD